MTPPELADYLRVLREANVMSAELKLPTGAEVRVVMGPDMPAVGIPMDTTIEPGAWKQWAGEGES
jgi:hypothetical protein